MSMDSETKQALEAMEARIIARFDQTEKRFGEVDKRFDQLYERMFDVETKLLSAFRDWQQPIQTRLRTLPLIDERLGLLEERITALELKNLERGQQPLTASDRSITFVTPAAPLQ